jgi:hypothetical protein
MSRDPEDGYIDEPASLHKYLYAGGDPVNRIDPHGRGDIADYAYVEVLTEIPWIVTTAKITAGVYFAICKAVDVLSWASTHLFGGPKFEMPEPFPLFCLIK